MKWKREHLLCVVVVALVALPSIAQAGHGGGRCYSAPCGPDACTIVGYRDVTKTVYVPTTVTETREVCVTRYRTEERTCNYVTYKCVPQTREVSQEYTVVVPHTRTKTVTCRVAVPFTREVEQSYVVMVPHTEQRQGVRKVRNSVPRTVEQTYTVMVPHTEQRQGVRRRCEYVPETVMRTVCRDNGRYEERQVACSNRCCHGSCCPVVQTCRVWVSDTVREQVPVQAMRPRTVEVPYTYNVTVCKPETRTRQVQIMECQVSEQPYTYNVTVCKPETRTRTVQVHDCRYEERTREVQYVECVPERRTRTCNVTTYTRVAQPMTRTYTVKVPYTEKQTVEVQVCRKVAQTVTCQVPIYGPAPCESCN